MKTSHIIAIIAIAIAIGMIISTIGDTSKYVNFQEAKEMAKNGDNRRIHVVGTLKKDKQGKILEMKYEPTIDPNYFAFTLIDANNVAQKVVFNNPKPADFERSEQVVVIGSYQENQFVANKILMKCPSKYQENKLEVKEAEVKKNI